MNSPVQLRSIVGLGLIIAAVGCSRFDDATSSDDSHSFGRGDHQLQRYALNGEIADLGEHFHGSFPYQISSKYSLTIPKQNIYESKLRISVSEMSKSRLAHPRY